MFWDGAENFEVSGSAVPAGLVSESRKVMAKTAVVTAQPGFVEQVKSLPERIKSFYGDVRNEMRKVTTPNRKEVEATTLVVIITVFIFGVYFWLVDGVIGRSLDGIFKYFSTH
jgi:preprotein translocase subunit SecE